MSQKQSELDGIEMKLIFFIDEKGKWPNLMCHNFTLEVVLLQLGLLKEGKKTEELVETVECKIALFLLELKTDSFTLGLSRYRPSETLPKT